MKTIRAIKILGEPYLGSTITIQAVFDETPTSVSIRIRDPWAVIRVDDVAMTGDSGGLYYNYDYQNTDVNNYGTYLAIIKATFGAKTIYKPRKFKLYDPDENVTGGF